MFCPECKYEFRRGFTHCNTCDVDLVETLPTEEEVDHTPPPTAAQMDHPTLLWSGANGGVFSALTTALDDAQIPYNKEELDARLVFTSQHGDLEVWVPVANLPQAQPILDAVLANPLNADAAASSANDAENEGDDAADALPDESDEGPDDIRHEYVARELHPEDASAEIWSGDNETLADVLKSCLAEIGVNCYLRTPYSDEEAGAATHTNKPADKPAAPFAVRVLPEDEEIARQIVREVTDGTPPQ
ncbi:MAG TPA: hypothetical protein VKB26_04955 [Candidatus Acidoferrales bacterium]|nr:hypothetical protein [Candidatus Acidoferrales bacterium]